jgi:hypothetical protein
MDRNVWIRQNFEQLQAEYQDTPMIYQKIIDFNDYCMTQYLNRVETRNFGNIDFNHWVQRNHDILRADYTHNHSNSLLAFEDYCREKFNQYCCVTVKSGEAVIES